MKYQVITQYKDESPEIKASYEIYEDATRAAYQELLLILEDMEYDLSEEDYLAGFTGGGDELAINGHFEFKDYTIGVVLENLNEPQSYAVEACQASMFCEWEDVWVTIHIDIEFMSRVAKCRNLLGQHPELNSVIITPCYGLIDDKSFQELDDAVRIGPERIEIDRYSAYYQIASKYDHSYHAEYVIANLRVRQNS